MANRVVLTFDTAAGFPETITAGDNIDMQSAGKVVNLAAATTSGDALSYGQSGATLAGLALTAALAMGGFQITNVGTPLTGTAAANRDYVDASVSGITWKAPVLALSSTNVTPLSGTATTVDGVALNTAGMRVLLTGQTTASQNGPWVVAAGSWTRPTDFAAGSHAASSAFFVEEGTANSDTGWTCTTDPPSDVVDTNNLTFVQFFGPNTVTASHGLTKVVNDVQVNPGDGITFDGGNVHTIVALDGTAPGLQFTGVSPSGRLKVLPDPNAGLVVAAAGVGVKPDTVTSGNPTVAVGANGLRVIGLPSLFNINSSAVSAAVTASNVNTLVAGGTSNADALHTHGLLRTALVTADALSSGDPVYISTTNNQVGKGRADTDAKSYLIGLNTNASVSATATAQIICQGVNPGVLVGATAGTRYYVDTAGGIVATTPPATGNIVQVGFALNATDLWVMIQRFGKRV